MLLQLQRHHISLQAFCLAFVAWMLLASCIRSRPYAIAAEPANNTNVSSGSWPSLIGVDQVGIQNRYHINSSVSSYHPGQLLGVYDARRGEGAEPLALVQVTSKAGDRIELTSIRVSLRYTQGLHYVLGGVAEAEHFSGTIGRVIDNPSAQTAIVDMGGSEGIARGDIYAVMNTSQRATITSRQTVGLLKVYDIKKEHAYANVIFGRAPPRSQIMYQGQEPSGVRPVVTIGLINFKSKLELEFAQALEEVTQGYMDQVDPLFDGVEFAALENSERPSGRSPDIVVDGSLTKLNDMVTVTSRVSLLAERWRNNLGDSSAMEYEQSRQCRMGRLLDCTQRFAAYLLGIIYSSDFSTGSPASYQRAAAFLAASVGEGADRGSVSALILLFYCLEYMRDWVSAEEISQLVMEIGDEEKSEHIKALGLYMLSRTDVGAGRLRDASSRAIRAIDIFRRIKDERSLLLAKHLLANIHYQRGDTQLAREVADSIAEEYVSFGYAWQLAKLDALIASTYFDDYMFDDARRVYQGRVLPVLCELGDKEGCADGWGAIANIAHRRGEVAKARSIYETKSLPVFGETGNVHSSARIIRSIALLDSHEGRIDEAIGAYQDYVIPMFIRTGDRVRALYCQAEMASFLLEKGGAENRRRAAELLDAAFSSANQMKIPGGEAIRKTAIDNGL